MRQVRGQFHRCRKQPVPTIIGAVFLVFTRFRLLIFVAGDLIISVSGLRGVVGETLTSDVACRYAAAFAETLPEGPVLITRDGRANGGQLVSPVAAGLSQGGRRPVLDAGIAATPTTGVLVRTHGWVGGVQISASHNPAEYNGLKLFSAQGRVVPADVGKAVLENFRMRDAGCSTPDIQHPASSIRRLAHTTTEHLALVERIVDLERIRSRRFRVLLDANHGSGSVMGRTLLERLGCDLVLFGGEPDGLFAHPPEPTAENLAGVLKEVTHARADVGFCQDPDADRLAIIDEAGRYIGEECTLAICVNHVLRRTPGPVVTNCSTSRMTEDLAGKYGVPFFRSAVGEANVVDVMLREKAILGGEGNGGVIDPRVGLVRDSFVGMALVLDAMAEEDLPISTLTDELPRYALHKTKVDVARDRVVRSFDRLERHFHDATPDRLDGLRLDWPHSWLLVRASNTEPIVRILAEAPSAAEARRLCDEAAHVMGAI
jgi:phosphomannomutase